ncbi:MAG: response regulator transcription factor [Actinocrinis sp.]
MAFDCEPTPHDAPRPPETRLPKRPGLTEREREVLRHVADGESTRQIAARLEITPSTARTYVDSVLTKLGVRSRGEAVAATVPIPGIPAGPPEAELLSTLTRREREVLAGMAEGLCRADIAARLCVSPHTVRTHVRNILAKLGARSTLEAVAVLRRAAVQLNGISAPLIRQPLSQQPLIRRVSSQGVSNHLPRIRSGPG